MDVEILGQYDDLGLDDFPEVLADFRPGGKVTEAEVEVFAALVGGASAPAGRARRAFAVRPIAA